MSDKSLKIGIFGGTRGVGFCALQQALEFGHFVTVLARNPDILNNSFSHKNLLVIKGDVLDRNAVESVVNGQDVIINSLGSKAGSDVNVCSQGTRVILQAIKDLNVKRILSVTSFGVGDSYKDASWAVRIFLWIIRKAIADKELEEEMIKESKLEWVILRPTGLTDGPIGDYKIGCNIPASMSVTRNNVADALLKQITSNEFLYKCPTVT